MTFHSCRWMVLIAFVKTFKFLSLKKNKNFKVRKPASKQLVVSEVPMVSNSSLLYIREGCLKK